jgi:hypothetical protein
MGLDRAAPIALIRRAADLANGTHGVLSWHNLVFDQCSLEIYQSVIIAGVAP